MTCILKLKRTKVYTQKWQNKNTAPHVTNTN